MSNGRTWTADDTATLSRMARAGYSDGEIAQHLGFCRETVTRRRASSHIERGMSLAMIAMLARLNLRRRMAA
jgi:IS30 family transposase